jgi:Uma2 family endonuclease
MTTTPTLERRYTAEEYDALEDRERYELVDGRLVERHMSYLSSAIAMVFARILGSFVSEHRLGTIFGPDLGVRINPSDPAHTRHADVGFVSRARAPGGDPGYLRVAPELIVEVVSPGDTANEVRAKVDEWLSHGVRMVWVAFPLAREVHVYATGLHPQIFTVDDEITAADVLPGFRSPVAALFPER